MKTVILIQLGLMALGAALLMALISTRGAISYAEGSGLVALNLGLLTWTWAKILNKKLIALATTIIVFKYAIFAVIIYFVLMHPSTDKLWFGVGLGTLTVTALLFAFLQSLKSKAK